MLGRGRDGGGEEETAGRVGKNNIFFVSYGRIPQEDKTLKQEHAAGDLGLAGAESGVPGKTDVTSKVRVTFETSLRLKYNNRLESADLPFHVLVRAMLRRISALFTTWAEASRPLITRGW